MFRPLCFEGTWRQRSRARWLMPYLRLKMFNPFCTGHLEGSESLPQPISVAFLCGWVWCSGQEPRPLDSPEPADLVPFFLPRKPHKITPSLSKSQQSEPLPIRAPRQPGPLLSKRVRKSWQFRQMLATLSDCFPYYPILIPLALFLIITTDSKFDAADTWDQRYPGIEEETAFVNHRNLML